MIKSSNLSLRSSQKGLGLALGTLPQLLLHFLKKITPKKFAMRESIAGTQSAPTPQMQVFKLYINTNLTIIKKKRG